MKPFFEIFKKWDELFSNSELKSPSADQIMQLEQQGNFSNNWSNVKFSKPDSTNLSVTVSRIRGCTFSGRTIIGCLAGDVEGPQGVQMFCGLTNSYFANDCIISDSCRIVDNILLKDVYVGTAAVILGCGTVVGRDPADAKGPFTYYAIELTLGPESDGRVVRAVAGMRYADICRQALGSQAQLEEKDAAAAPSRSSWFTVIGDGAKVVKCDEVVNCLIGCDSRIASSCLSNCVVLSVPGRRVLIESGARLSCCIINEACSLGMNCHAEDSFLCECSSLGDFARVCQSVLGPDSSVAGGECHHCLLGPFVGFHHHSLLIATVWPTGRGKRYPTLVITSFTELDNSDRSQPSVILCVVI
jgi:NDP-sugar pyrophosphorylase family protein